MPGARPIAILLLIGVASGHAQTIAPEWVEQFLREVRDTSFPELSNADIRVQAFISNSDYFQARHYGA
jgi:hypothetical protein